MMAQNQGGPYDCGWSGGVSLYGLGFLVANFINMKQLIGVGELHCAEETVEGQRITNSIEDCGPD